MRTAIARLGVTALLAAGGLTLAPAAQAASGCEDGVTVVVQQESSTSAECAEGDPKTAGEALESAGFEVEKVQSDPKMLCTIDGAPETSCAKAPEADAFWGFFTSTDGGPWAFATKGVFDYDPKPGTAIGFRYGSGDAPTTSAKKAASSLEETASPDSDETAAADSSEESQDEGSNARLPTVVGVGVLAVLAGAAFLVARRRRG